MHGDLRPTTQKIEVLMKTHPSLKGASQHLKHSLKQIYHLSESRAKSVTSLPTPMFQVLC